MNQLDLFGEYKLCVGHKTITTFYNPKRERWILLISNCYSSLNQTFFNEKNEMLEWVTEDEAIAYVEKFYGNIN